MGVAVAACSFVATPAQAYGTPGCVTKQEYRKVQKGFRKPRVRRIFAAKGKQTFTFTSGGNHYESREYDTCSSKYGFVSIDFKNSKLTDKMAYWG